VILKLITWMKARVHEDKNNINELGEQGETCRSTFKTSLYTT
jgi:hypothetical protein